MTTFGLFANILPGLRRLFSVALIVIYVCFPVSALAYDGAPDDGRHHQDQGYSSSTGAVPGDDCPCSDENGSGCCEAACCSCECHAPLDRRMQLIYAPVVARQAVFERPCYLPQVYRSIIVPPQNCA